MRTDSSSPDVAATASFKAAAVGALALAPELALAGDTGLADLEPVDDAQHLELVAGRCRVDQHGPELAPSRQDLVKAVAFERNRAGRGVSRIVDGRDDRTDVDLGQRWLGELHPDEPVPPTVQQAGELTDAVRRHGERVRHQEIVSGIRIGEQLVTEALPPMLEPDTRLDVVVDLERGRQACIERVLSQDPVGEPVQRRDRGGVEPLACDPTPLALVVGERAVGRRNLERRRGCGRATRRPPPR